MRGKSIQAMMKAGSVRFDAEADWYPDFYAELMTVTPAGPKGKHDDCFPADAPIITKDGIKKIKDVTTNDFVLTRKGYKRVLKSWCKGEKKVITRFGITATPNHRIYTSNRSWVSLDALADDDIIVVSRGKSLCERLLYSTATVITDTLKQSKAIIGTIIRTTTTGSQHQECCIETHGYSTTEKFQPNSRSIISTKTLITTKLTTSNVFRAQSIKQDTKKKGLSEEGQKNHSGILTILDTFQKSGMAVKKAISGIKLTRKPPYSEISLKNHARGVKKSLSLSSLFINTAQGNAKTNITQEHIAQEKQPVYDLMIEDQHEFFAYGVLVHNCFDAFAYIGLTIHKHNTAPSIEEYEDDEWNDEHEEDNFNMGICSSTGY